MEPIEMKVKLVVLYPHPANVEKFEKIYNAKHMPLMRELVGSSVPLPTCLTVSTPERPAPYYRIAEIHFRDEDHFNEFISSGKSKIGRDSSVEVSTGGKPIYLVCREQPEI
jgi:uncharacterized protein (TIGR02118 family)